MADDKRRREAGQADRGKFKKANSAPGRRLPEPSSEKTSVEPKCGEDEERQRLF